MNDPLNIVLYGANGYTAQLILGELLQRGIKPIIAGRNADAIAELSKKHNLESIIFNAEDHKTAQKSLYNIHTLINCAGPFVNTAEHLMDTCLSSGTNYIDITGEIKVFEAAWERNKKAQEKGIVILPGAGFDVIPTDCVAKKLKDKMPDATYLKLAIATRGSNISRGTLLTSISQFGEKAFIRQKGEMVPIELGSKSMKINFGEFTSNTVAIQWGDVFNAYYSTGIPNIEIYFAMPGALIKLLKSSRLFNKIISSKSIKQILRKYVSSNLNGPNEKQRNKSRTYIWGQVENKKGDKIEELFEFPDGYNLTIKGVAEIVTRLLKKEIPAGTQTPSLAFGSNFMNLFMLRQIR